MRVGVIILVVAAIGQVFQPNGSRVDGVVG